MRLFLLTGIPASVLIAIELGLRIGQFGYPTSFLLPCTQLGQDFYTQNNQFGWRFFGPRLARQPCPIFISKTKAPGTVRIFVFGESAAFGDPQSDFGLPRMLQAWLSLRYPGVHFEVVNAGMTAINSNVILPIAQDCAQADGDIWVLYMGNNEVVGPFGAGTVFGSQTAPLPLVRASIALQSTKTGQLLNSFRQWMEKPVNGRQEWGGMAMFLNQQVRADDPRMKRVYDHFQKNLAAILKTGRDKGVGIVASTVAVNLKDCAPFASSCRTADSNEQVKELKRLCELGSAALAAGNIQGALRDFSDAEQIDDTVAEIHYQKAKCELALNRAPEAQKEFGLARDLDTLRFRCDGRLNNLIRSTVSGLGDKEVLLADADRVLTEQSPDGLPGDNYFYEHVHLNFHGNFLLAKTIAEQVEKLLPQRIGQLAVASDVWPAESDCARRLGWSDENQLRGLAEIYARLADPPFTAQSSHAIELAKVERKMKEITEASPSARVAGAIRICEEALAVNPADAFLHQQLALLRQQSGDVDGAIIEARQATERLPSYAEAWAALGVMQAQKNQAQAAFDALHQALQLDPMNVLFRRNFALSEVMLGDQKAAIRDFQLALRLSPHYGPAWLGLGSVFEQMQGNDEARHCYQNALAYRVPQVPDLLILAHFCQNRGWFDGASTCYEDAIKLNPWNTRLTVEAEHNLELWAHHPEASNPQATANIEPAATSWGGAANLTEARLNLGTVLANTGHPEDALSEFETVGPANPVASHYIQTLRRISAQEPLAGPE